MATIMDSYGARSNVFTEVVMTPNTMTNTEFTTHVLEKIDGEATPLE
jgi:hypothetical protein